MTRELDSLLDEVRMNMEYNIYSRLHDEIMSMESDFEETLLLKQRIKELEEPKTCEGCMYAQVRYYDSGTVWFKDVASSRCNSCSRNHDDNYKQNDTK